MQIRQGETIIELTNEELDTIKNFTRFLNNENSLDIYGAWDVMVSIMDEDEEVLKYYGYSLKILDN